MTSHKYLHLIQYRKCNLPWQSRIHTMRGQVFCVIYVTKVTWNNMGMYHKQKQFTTYLWNKKSHSLDEIFDANIWTDVLLVNHFSLVAMIWFGLILGTCSCIWIEWGSAKKNRWQYELKGLHHQTVCYLLFNGKIHCMVNPVNVKMSY